MKKMLSLICIVLISITTSYAQSNYDLELAEKYTHEAKYYQQKAVDYRKDANYYLSKAKEYQKESVYYTRKGNVDRAKSRTKYYEDAMDKYKLRIRYAEEAEDKAALYHSKAARAIKNYNYDECSTITLGEDDNNISYWCYCLHPCIRDIVQGGNDVCG